MAAGEDIAKNTENLSQLAKLLLNAIANSASNLPLYVPSSYYR
jgi:hypothetical protein